MAKHQQLIWLGAVGVHLLLFALWQGQPKVAVLDLGESTEPMGVARVELVGLDSGEDATRVTVSLVGASDFVGTEVAMHSASDAPGLSPGQRAPGIGGPDSFADRQDQNHRSASPWNTNVASLMPHTGRQTAKPASRERIERSRTRSYSDQAPRAKLAHPGDSASVAGLPSASGLGGVPGDSGDEWASLDPRFDSAPKKSEVLVPGAVQLQRESALHDVGPEASEQAVKGAAGDKFLAPDRSNQSQASAFHLGAPTTGQGTEAGASGRSGASTSNQGGRGHASQSGQGERGKMASTRASRANPYFYQMYRRIDQELRFPRKLALALEQGELALSFSLDSEGQVHGLKVSKKSGFAAFDAEALRAFRAAAPFGPVPQALLKSRDRLRVVAPYYFRNPLIR